MFYPPRMPPADALARYSSVFDTVEVNATFHAVPPEETVRGWYRRTPPNFTFALKFPREITHDLLLEWPAVAQPTQLFIERAKLLDDKLGPLLLQLPPAFDATENNWNLLRTFLDQLPTPQIKLALELRGTNWANAELERELRARNIAWCLVDGFTRNARVLIFPTDFVYIRWNRSGRQFDGFSEIQDDRSADLDWWTDVLRSLPERVHTVYGYMANEFAGHAPASLRMLSQRLGLAFVEPKQTWPQGVLF